MDLMIFALEAETETETNILFINSLALKMENRRINLK